jgi:hypothetical protein
VRGPVLSAGEGINSFGNRSDGVNLPSALCLGLVLAALDYMPINAYYFDVYSGGMLTEVVLEVLDSGVRLFNESHKAIVV